MSDWTEAQVMEGYTDENGNPINVQEELNALKDEENPFSGAGSETVEPTQQVEEENPFAGVGDNSPDFRSEDAVVATEEQPVGIGPVSSPEAYSEMVRPGYQKARSEVGPWTARATIATEAAVPVLGAWSDDLYAAIKANTNPKLTFDEWQNAITEEQEKLPMTDTAASVGAGAIAGYALPWGSLKLLKDSATAMKIAAGFNNLSTAQKMSVLALASGVEGVGSAKKDISTSEGQKEAAIQASIPMAFKGFAELAGRTGGWLWKKFTPDVDTKNAIDDLIKNPYRFDDLAGAQEEREAAIRIYGQVVEKINEMHNAGKMSAEEASKKIIEARKEWEKYEDIFSTAAAKAGNLSNEETTGVFKAYKDLQQKVRVLEKEAIAKLPENSIYASDPEKYGFKIADIENIKNSYVSKLKSSSKTYANALIGQLNEQMEMFYRKAGEDAIANGADPAAVAYVMRNRQWLTDPKSRGVLSGKNISQNKMMADSMTNVKDVNRAVALMSNVSPSRVHEMKNTLFERGSGYVSQRDLTDEIKQTQKIYKDWHQDIRGKMAERYDKFEEATQVAENLKKEVLFPVKAKLKLKETDKEGARLAFEGFAKEQHDQATNVINRWSQEIGVDLIQSANRIRHLNEYPLISSGGKWNLSFDEMMDHIAEKKKIGGEVLEGLKFLPPEIRAKFVELEIAAKNAVDSQKDIDMITDRLMKESDKYGKFIGMPTMRGDGTRRSVQSIVEEITTKRYNPSSKSLFDVTPEVRDARDIERFSKELFPAGIFTPNGGTVQINGLANRLQEVRKQELLDKSLNLFKGSSAANIGQAIGASRGPKSAALLALAGSLVNSIGSLGAKTVVRGIIKSKFDTTMARTYSDLVTANVARNVLPSFINYSATVGTQALADVIAAVRSDDKMSASNKVKVIKDLKENGLNIQVATTE